MDWREWLGLNKLEKTIREGRDNRTDEQVIAENEPTLGREVFEAAERQWFLGRKGAQDN